MRTRYNTSKTPARHQELYIYDNSCPLFRIQYPKDGKTGTPNINTFTESLFSLLTCRSVFVHSIHKISNSHFVTITAYSVSAAYKSLQSGGLRHIRYPRHIVDVNCWIAWQTCSDGQHVLGWRVCCARTRYVGIWSVYMPGLIRDSFLFFFLSHSLTT